MTSAQNTPLIRAEGIAKAYCGHRVLSDVHLAMHAGEIVTLIGLNGSGKTTLLKILMGLVQPDAGSVERKAGLRIGYMPQKMNIDAAMPISVADFLALSPRSRGALSQIVEELAVAPLLTRPLATLSGGETQRVMLARALLCAPELLALDEPVQGVDMAGQAELYELISRISKQRGCAVLMVSHDLHLVMAATEKVICLNQHICCEGTPHTVSRDPGFVALFGHQVAESLAVYTHHHDHSHDMEGKVIHDHAH